jgi:hypothetical protein
MRHGISRTFSRILEHILVKQAENERFTLTSSSAKRRPAAPTSEPERGASTSDCGDTSSTDEVVHRMAGLLGRLKEDDRRSLLSMAQKLAREERGKPSSSSHGNGEGDVANDSSPSEEY